MARTINVNRKYAETTSTKPYANKRQIDVGTPILHVLAQQLRDSQATLALIRDMTVDCNGGLLQDVHRIASLAATLADPPE